MNIKLKKIKYTTKKINLPRFLNENFKMIFLKCVYARVLDTKEMTTI